MARFHPHALPAAPEVFVSCPPKNYARPESWELGFTGATGGLWPGRQHFRELWTTAPERQGKCQCICGLGDGEVHASKHLAEGCRSWGADITMKDLSAFLDTRRCKNWAHQIFSGKHLTLWRPVLPVFPEHKGPLSWSPPWALSGGVEVPQLQWLRILSM